MLTPDSSRFWPADDWRPGTNPPSFDKQPLRDWLEAQPWDKQPPPPPLPAEIVAGHLDALRRRLRAGLRTPLWPTGTVPERWPTREQFSVLVEVRLRPGIADPQGATIERALPALGLDGVTGVRAGKAFRFDVDAADEADALAQATEVADRLLANPVIEESSVDACRPGRAPAGPDGRPGRRRRLPGHQLRARRGPGARAPRGRRPSWSGTATRRSPATTPSSCPAASPTATTCGPGPSPASRRSWRRSAEFAADGGPVVGICNGFQVLTEAGLLPGALQKNRGLRFLCTTVDGAGRVAATRCSPPGCRSGTELRIPINHFEGNYTCDADDPGRAPGRGPDRAALRRQPERLGRRHRRRLQRRPATWSASCPIPSGHRTRCSARPTVPLLRSLLGAAAGGSAGAASVPASTTPA